MKLEFVTALDYSGKIFWKNNRGISIFCGRHEE